MYVMEMSDEEVSKMMEDSSVSISQLKAYTLVRNISYIGDKTTVKQNLLLLSDGSNQVKSMTMIPNLITAIFLTKLSRSFSVQGIWRQRKPICLQQAENEVSQMTC
jgi:hypothetical protein